MNWIALIIAIAFNSLACGLIVLAQNADRRMPGRHTIIPGSAGQPFLYWQDFYCQQIGCLFGLPLVIAGYFSILGSNLMTPIQGWVTPIITIIVAVGFTLMCLGKNHKPDYGFPFVGLISSSGKSHSAYWGLMIAVSAICVWSIISGTLRGPMMWLTIVGGIIYLISFVCDIKAGHFAPLRVSRSGDIYE